MSRPTRGLPGVLLAAAVLTSPGVAAAQAEDESAPEPAMAELAPRPADTRLADAAESQHGQAVRRLLTTKGVDVDGPGADGATALHWAVLHGDLELVDVLLRNHAGVNRPNGVGLTPLGLAAQLGAVETMAALIKAGADVDAVDSAGETPLMAATRKGTAAGVALLLDHGAKIDRADESFGQTALMIASRGDRPELVDLLIKRGANVHTASRVRPGARPRMQGEGGGSHGEGIIRMGVPVQGAKPPQPGGMTPLIYAARDGRLESVKLLLDAGARIDQAEVNGQTALLMATMSGKVETARLLIQRGANVNAQDWYGRTPVWAVIDYRNLVVNEPRKDNGVDRPPLLDLLRQLLERGADPNARVKEYPPDRRYILTLGNLAWVDITGQTPFFRAAGSGDVDAMKLLLQFKADPKLATFSGTTALAAAAGVNWVPNENWTESPENLLEAVKLCAELGIDVNAANNMGLTAMHGAANRGSDDIILYLVSKGGDLTAKDKVGRTPLVWAGGVFLATNAAEPKPSTQALIKSLLDKSATAARTKPAYPTASKDPVHVASSRAALD
jgi:ankyrin repeat protein